MNKLFPALLFAAVLLVSKAGAQGICAYCGANSTFGGNPFYNSMGSYSMPSFFPGSYPWWGGYGAMAYSNFSYPGAWSGGGMSGGSYPHAGGGFLGKPNLYVSGKAGTEVQVQVKMAPESHWLVAVPAHGKSGWKGTLLEDGKIKVGEKAVHDFFFYDYRCDETRLQDSAGFCTERETLIERLALILKRKGFRPNEIKDFETYWSVKLPPSERYCVYPQEDGDLNKVVELEISPKPKRALRIAFMIIPEEGRKFGGANRKFLKLPEKEWVSAEGPVESARVPATSDDLEVHEWSVGFIQAPDS